MGSSQAIVRSRDRTSALPGNPKLPTVVSEPSLHDASPEIIISGRIKNLNNMLVCKTMCLCDNDSNANLFEFICLDYK